MGWGVEGVLEGAQVVSERGGGGCKRRGEADTTRDLSSSHAWSGSILFVIPPMATQPGSNHSPKSLREEKNNKKKKKKKGGRKWVFGARPPAAMQTLQFGRVRSA